jgi:multidrug transporter EmrE-like cation transporter
MPIPVLGLILISVALSALAQITLKYGMSSTAVKAVLADGSFLQAAATIISNPSVIGGLGLYMLGAALWLGVLARVDVSLAYPFVALGFILTMVLSALLLAETLTPSRIVGTLIIVLGVVILTRSP